MTLKNDREAYCLANTYGLMPPLPVYPSRTRKINSGKYEPDHDEAASTRCMVLAHFAGGTNCIVKYTPANLELE